MPLEAIGVDKMNDVLGVKLFSPMEATKIMGIGKNKIYELINNNKIEYVNFAGKYRISEKGIQGYLEQNTKKLDNSVVFSKV